MLVPLCGLWFCMQPAVPLFLCLGCVFKRCVCLRVDAVVVVRIRV